ncbi:unnamed protein product [Urochloa humidicola]
MAATTDDTNVLTMKLVVDTRYRRVLFAKITRDVVDFLYSLLNSPGSPISLDDMIWDGCTDNIVVSVEELDDLEADAEDAPPSPPQQQQQARRRFFVCGVKRRAGCRGYVALKSGATCPSCRGAMDAEAPRGAPGAGCSGHPAPPAPPPPQQQEQQPAAVAPLTCTLMDDLSIGLAPGEIINLAIMKGASAAAFQEETVRLGHKEGLEILKASLESSTVLTDVFLRGEAPAAGDPI